jgi:hypothetical protein
MVRISLIAYVMALITAGTLPDLFPKNIGAILMAVPALLVGGALGAFHVASIVAPFVRSKEPWEL